MLEGGGLLILIMMAFVFIMIIAGLLGLLALFGVPKLFDFVKLFHKGEEKNAFKKLLYSFLFVFPFLLFIVSLLDKYGLFYQVCLGIFLVSSFLGLAIFILFIYSLKKKHNQNIIKSFLMGGVVFLFFAPSSFFTLKPIVIYMIEHPDISKINIFDIILPSVDELFSDINLTVDDSILEKRKRN